MKWLTRSCWLCVQHICRTEFRWSSTSILAATLSLLSLSPDWPPNINSRQRGRKRTHTLFTECCCLTAYNTFLGWMEAGLVKPHPEVQWSLGGCRHLCSQVHAGRRIPKCWEAGALDEMLLSPCHRRTGIVQKRIIRPCSHLHSWTTVRRGICLPWSWLVFMPA